MTSYHDHTNRLDIRMLELHGVWNSGGHSTDDHHGTGHHARCGMSVMTDLQMLFNQQLSEHREIKDLREKLRAAETRYQNLADEIERVRMTLPHSDRFKFLSTALPLSGDDTAISLTPAGTAPASEHTQVAGRGFSEVDALVAFQRNRERNTEQFDNALGDGVKQLRAGNPQFDKEWAL